MTKALRYAEFGGIEQLKWEEVPEQHAAAGQLRVHVTTVGLNPMDWLVMKTPGIAEQFGVHLPQIFAYDFAGVVDEVGADVTNYKVGDRVFGTTYDGAAAEQIILSAGNSTRNRVFKTPDSVSDDVAATLGVGGLTAANCLMTIGLTADDTVLIGGAAGGVGVFAVQLAKLRGARVIGTSAPSTFDFLEKLGAEPVAYGDGLAESVANLGLTAAIDLYSHDVVHLALAEGIPPEKITSIIMYPPLPDGVKTSTGGAGTADDMAEILSALTEGKLTVPIAGKYAISDYEAAINEQMSRHVHGKIIISLD